MRSSRERPRAVSCKRTERSSRLPMRGGHIRLSGALKQMWWQGSGVKRCLGGNPRKKEEENSNHRSDACLSISACRSEQVAGESGGRLQPGRRNPLDPRTEKLPNSLCSDVKGFMSKKNQKTYHHQITESLICLERKLNDRAGCQIRLLGAQIRSDAYSKRDRMAQSQAVFLSLAFMTFYPTLEINQAG